MPDPPAYSSSSSHFCRMCQKILLSGRGLVLGLVKESLGPVDLSESAYPEWIKTAIKIYYLEFYQSQFLPYILEASVSFDQVPVQPSIPCLRHTYYPVLPWPFFAHNSDIQVEILDAQLTVNGEDYEKYIYVLQKPVNSLFTLKRESWEVLNKQLEG
nr:hypothetical protein L203_00617 [Cryptococcus depauperatus CBS 7841]